jgi:hypothetical protein
VKHGTDDRKTYHALEYGIEAASGRVADCSTREKEEKIQQRCWKKQKPEKQNTTQIEWMTVGMGWATR